MIYWEQDESATRGLHLRDALPRALIILLPLTYVLVLFGVPLFMLIVYSLSSRVGYEFELLTTWGEYRRFASEPNVQLLLLKAIRIASIVTLISLAIGYPVAYFLARYAPPSWRFPILVALIIPSWTSLIIRSFSWLSILGDKGVINETLKNIGAISTPLPLAFNEFAVQLALINISIPWLILPIYLSIQKIDSQLVDAASSLGSSAWRSFWYIVWPLSLPGVISGVVLVFVPAVSQFAVSQLLGGNAGYAIGNHINYMFLQFEWPYGAALSVIMLMISVVLVGLFAWAVQAASGVWGRL